jgi:hypothetical protein
VETGQRPREPHADGTFVFAAPSPPTDKTCTAMSPLAKEIVPNDMVDGRRRSRLWSVWACSRYTLVATVLGSAFLLLMARSFMTRQLDTKGCEMSYMRPAFVTFDDFDTEHTRFATKYSLHLYREGGIDEDTRVCAADLNWQISANHCVGQRRARTLHSRKCR